MRLFGLSPIYEVRTISQITGKDLPGTRLHHGTSYSKAVKAFRGAKIKDGHMVRLQAMVSLDSKRLPAFAQTLAEATEPMVVIPPDMVVVEEASRIPGIEGEKTIVPNPSVAAPQTVMDLPGVDDEPAPTLPDDLSSMAEQGDIEKKTHDCNYSGPMQFYEGTYVASCSVCGTPHLTSGAKQ